MTPPEHGAGPPPGADPSLVAWHGLVSLPGVGPARLWQIAVGPGPQRAWADLRAGRLPEPWRSPCGRGVLSPEILAAASEIDAAAVAAAHRSAGIELVAWGDADHPAVAPDDPHVGPVLFVRRGPGVSRADDAPVRRVAVIGTRRATRLGRDIARELGSELASAGLDVVSGLALGIDAAAHEGALAALRDGAAGRVTAVIGTGLDVVYPRANATLSAAVASAGSMLSEYPLGTGPAPWRFPARNRVVVACCEAVVVVESHERGGSLITAGLAGERGVPVLSVPGSIRSPASIGTNRLIADGCAPCLGAADVLTAIGWVPPSAGRSAGGAQGALPFGDGPADAVVDGRAQEVLEIVGVGRCSFDEVADALPTWSLGEVMSVVRDLVRQGLLHDGEGQLERSR